MRINDGQVKLCIANVCMCFAIVQRNATAAASQHQNVARISSNPANGWSNAGARMASSSGSAVVSPDNADRSYPLSVMARDSPDMRPRTSPGAERLVAEDRMALKKGPAPALLPKPFHAAPAMREYDAQVAFLRELLARRARQVLSLDT
jgi:hypothetical protein